MNRLLILFLLFLIYGCGSNHLISDKDLRDLVSLEFAERKIQIVNRNSQLYSVFDSSLTIPEKEALQFLFASMPLNDLADYSGEFFLANTRIALQSRKEMEWGNSVPADCFLNYVLPVRVNNENLDSLRILYYDELKSRIEGLNPTDAALEINHWCHEKVEYKPADIRTSAPMATVLSARGRCGEESTFTVAALRTVGIPARQVYTPRWAHTDDNHAWVEFWANGEWHYMGACEPEPVANRGWFTEPARRAMLVHTKAFGVNRKAESVISNSKRYSIINTLKRYAITKELCVEVRDSLLNLLPGAVVDFGLYNSAEFYPIAELITDKNGIVKLETGLGDLLVSSSYKGLYQSIHVSGSYIDTVRLVLSHIPRVSGGDAMDIVPPLVQEPFPPIAPLLESKNKIRLAYEDSLRRRYIASWPSEAQIDEVAAGWKEYHKKVAEIIIKSEGNFREIISLLNGISEKERETAVRILSAISDKDLRDTPGKILADHIRNVSELIETVNMQPDELFWNCVANPRISNEILKPWRTFIKTFFANDNGQLENSFPSSIEHFLDTLLIISDSDNYYETPVTPQGVLELKISDVQSRNICFVAICRTFGFPARIEESSGIAQYYSDSKWIDAFASVKDGKNARGFITFETEGSGPMPEYFVSFTVARFDGQRYRTLDLGFGQKLSELEKNIPAEPGYYKLVMGSRLSDGTVLTNSNYFDLAEGEKKTISVILRQKEDANRILGTVDKSLVFKTAEGVSVKLEDLSFKGAILIWHDGNSEPSRHIVNDLIPIKNELNNWGGNVLLISDEYNPSELSYEKNSFPLKTLVLYDNRLSVLNSFIERLACGEYKLPVVIAIDEKGSARYYSSGYNIGTGTQVLQALGKDRSLSVN